MQLGWVDYSRGTKGDNSESNWISWFQEYPPKELHEILAGVLTTRCDWEAVFLKRILSISQEDFEQA